MKKNLLFFVFMGLVLVFTSCVSMPVQLIGNPSEDLEVYTDRGVSVLIGHTENLDIAVSASNIQNEEGSFICTISNKGNTPFNFRDAYVELFYKNKEDMNWKSMGVWDAYKFYNDYYKSFKTSLILTVLSGTLNTFNASMESTHTTHIHTSEGNTTIYTRSYNPSRAAMAAIAASEDFNRIDRKGRDYLSFLKNNLLYSSTIHEGEDYSGVIIFKDKKADSYMARFSLPEKTMDFVFSAYQK